MTKKIKYDLNNVYKFNILDMSFSIRIVGHIIYRKTKYKITNLKTHGGPLFRLEYYEIPNKKIDDILKIITPKLFYKIESDLKNFPNSIGKYSGEIELDDNSN